LIKPSLERRQKKSDVGFDSNDDEGNARINYMNTAGLDPLNVTNKSSDPTKTWAEKYINDLISVAALVTIDSRVARDSSLPAIALEGINLKARFELLRWDRRNAIDARRSEAIIDSDARQDRPRYRRWRCITWTELWPLCLI